MITVQQQPDIPRDRARQLGEETVGILKRGEYFSKGGMKIDLRKPVLHAVESTVTYSPDKPLPITDVGYHAERKL